MAGSTPDNGLTILDYLNEDCWWAVLHYVPIQDIIRTECTSRRWRDMVLTYLQCVPIGIKSSGCRNVNSEWPQVRWLTLRLLDAHLGSFESWTNKLGPSVVSAHCSRNSILTLIRKNCSNLQDLTIYNLRDVINQNGSFECLRRICFDGCYSIPVDYCISRLMCKTVEKLEINDCRHVTGQCLTYSQWTNLTSLSLDNCDLQSRNLLTATCLSQLTSFELRYAGDTQIYEEIHLLLDKMRKLERLCVLSFDGRINSGRFYESVSRLKRLNNLLADLLATDEDLEAMACHCQNLTILRLTGHYHDGVSGRGVAALCRHAGARLTTLGLQGDRLTEDDVVAIVSRCPKLEFYYIQHALLVVGPRAGSVRIVTTVLPVTCREITVLLDTADEASCPVELVLDVRGLGLSGAVLARAAAARRGRPCLLHIAGDFDAPPHVEYKELKYHRGWKSRNACAKCS